MSRYATTRWRGGSMTKRAVLHLGVSTTDQTVGWHTTAPVGTGAEG